ncbi:ATP-binding cassette domain-containing protein [Nocardia sp. R6R-6]|uniref:ATP-binding cassette domain-containing protein n=1 Tax=Nocardia sp. R6R-6 TaxID=3459303 RepID=UPI00403E14FE
MRTPADLGSTTATPGGTGSEPLLRFRSLTKRFGGVAALADVDLDVRGGEVHALLGQNGSGKSTLIKVLAGVYAADPPTRAWYNGRAVDIGRASVARRPNLHVVHQDPGLVLEMNVVDNLALLSGFETRGVGLVDWKRMRRRAMDTLGRFDLNIDVVRPLSEATPVERVLVAIAFAVSGFSDGASLLVLDEPTAVLPHHESERLLDIVRRLRDQGIAVLYVSHRLDEVLTIADRVTVLRDGHRVATRGAAGLTRRDLAELVAGSGVGESGGYQGPGPGAVSVLAVEGLSTNLLQGFDLELHRGEIVGLAGLPGSGAHDVLDVLAGQLRPDAGRVRYGDREQPWCTGALIARHRLPIVPADRIHHGIIAGFDVRENLTLSVVDDYGWLPLDRAGELDAYRDWSRAVGLIARSPAAAILTLSGGNQQKVVIGRCLLARPDVLLLSEPTAGVDIESRRAIYDLLRERCARGLTVLMISTDPADLVALCNRVIVVRGGSAARELVGPAIDEATLLSSVEEITDEH